MSKASLWLGALLLVCAGIVLPAQRPRSYHFVNGQWFDAGRFRSADFYVANGMLSTRRPEAVDEVVDLARGFVIPPFADAHTHNFETPFGFDDLVRRYLNAGIFYAKVQTNPRSSALLVAGRVNRPESVDVSYAHGALTSSYGHGVEIYEGLALFRRPGSFNAEEIQRVRTSRLRDNDAYYRIDSAADLEAKWPQILAGKPGFLKVYLLTSEEHDARTRRTDTVGDRGIDPALTPIVVQKAHAAGLRVSAHVDTVTDYRVALNAGVDEMAHMPGYLSEDTDVRRYELTETDAREAARRGIWVIPAPLVYPASGAGADPVFQKRTDGVRKRNLELLKRHHVKIALGSDRYGQLVVDDVAYLKQLGVFSNGELLTIWSEDTPQTIFPGRRIGKLADGYEASFLVLERNPLDDFANVSTIKRRFKQGTAIVIR